MLVYSTNPDLMREEEETVETLSPDRQQLRVSIERHHRGGKTVTLVRGFVGTDDDLNDLVEQYGAIEPGREIVIQGELKEKVTTLLRTMGYSRTK